MNKRRGDLENFKAYQREWKKERRKDDSFKEKEVERNKEWRELNKQAISESKRKYYLENLETIRLRKKLAYESRKKRNTGFDSELTSLVEAEARDLVKLRKKLTGIRWSINHIIPLHGKTVSGLHVWNNIRVTLLALNKRKANSYEEVCSGYRDQPSTQ